MRFIVYASCYPFFRQLETIYKEAKAEMAFFSITYAAMRRVTNQRFFGFESFASVCSMGSDGGAVTYKSK